MIDEHVQQEDLALHAMQALPEGEAAAVRAHLTDCAACQNDLAALIGDLAMVGLSVEQHPLPEGRASAFPRQDRRLDPGGNSRANSTAALFPRRSCQ